MSQLEHENLVAMVGICFGPLGMVLEMCECGDLLHALRRGQVADNALKQRIALDVARGMAYLHGLSPPVAHRDLRSPNVFLVSLDSRHVCAKVADFGLATSVATFACEALLTWQWMAPEAYEGVCYDERADNYSFGIILWEIVNGTGTVPFQEYLADADGRRGSVGKYGNRELLRQVMQNGLRPSVLRPQFGALPGLVQLMQQLWDPLPSRRPAFAVCVVQLDETKRSLRSFGLRRHPARPQPRAQERIHALAKSAFSVTVKPVELGAMDERIKCFLHVGDTLWLGCDHGGVYCANATTGVVETEHRAAHGATAVNALCIGPDLKVWSGGSDGRLLRWQRKFKKLQEPVSLSPREWKPVTVRSPRGGAMVPKLGRSRSTGFGSGGEGEGEGEEDAAASGTGTPRHLSNSSNPHLGAQVLCLLSGQDVCVSGDSKGTLCVWKSDCLVPSVQMKQREPIVALAPGPAGIVFVASGSQVFRLRPGAAALEPFCTHAGARMPRIHAMGAWLVSYSKDELRVWSAEDGRLLKVMSEAQSRQHFHTAGTVECNGAGALWLGCNDEVLVVSPQLTIARRLALVGDVVQISEKAMLVRSREATRIVLFSVE